MGLHSNTRRITNMFCATLLGITLLLLVLRLTAFRDMAVINGPDVKNSPEKSTGESGSGEISGSDEFPYSVNGKIYFPSVGEKGNVLVQNPEGNEYFLSIDIVDMETEKSLYYTGALEPGTSIDADVLSLDGQKLGDGVYECTARIAAISPDTFGTVQSEEKPVTIYIGETPK